VIIAGLLEFLGDVLLLLGFFTHSVAFILSEQMAIATSRRALRLSD
jgi:uncharacterized membrane protein YphA (DoxX/SURF4 family)